MSGIVIGIIIGVISSIIATYLYKFFERKRAEKEIKKRLKELEDEFVTPGSKIIVNLSGHPLELFEENWNKDKEPPINIKFGNIDETRLLDEAIRLFLLIPEDIRLRIKKGEDVIFALPGLSKLANLLITIIHAYSGKFPVITTSIQSKEGKGFIWQKPIDLCKVRKDNRLLRIIG
ncbi:MAG: CRISPR-associated protein Csx15 [candidate division WOR-3 bacterium]